VITCVTLKTIWWKKIDYSDTFPKANTFAKHSGKYLPYPIIDVLLRVISFNFKV
jgi:hypothetical protein